MVKKWHLQAIIEVRRHLLGKKGRNRWCTFQDRQRDLNIIFTTLRNRSSGLGLSQIKVDTILTETGKGPTWWLQQSALFADTCDDQSPQGQRARTKEARHQAQMESSNEVA